MESVQAAVRLLLRLKKTYPCGYCTSQPDERCECVSSGGAGGDATSGDATGGDVDQSQQASNTNTTRQDATATSEAYQYASNRIGGYVKEVI